MNETVMNLSSDGRIVQIDNVSWSYYIDVDRARSFEDHKSGKWMHFFNDIACNHHAESPKVAGIL